MDDRITKIDSPEKCEIFAKNAIKNGRQDLANEALLRATELRAESYGAATQAEKEALQAIYAYEETLRVKNGKKTRATRTWQMIERHGIIESVNRAVCRTAETQGYRALLDMGLGKFAFEAVILRFPEVFSTEAVQVSRERLSNWEST
ncbi:MAG: hypothetical protein LBJ37_16165 [Paucimonas sp.]|jgi:Skp family chaperone for outer membrane proteins|nr:hypothetical protein [Paucimonas sp.]